MLRRVFDRAMRAVRPLTICAALTAFVASAHAQVPTNETWRTIHTRHFNVHFTQPLEREARHAAAVAERAYANLASELVPPRGVVDLVLSDATDVSNGSATVIPRARVLIYARPPVDQPSLESYDDWTVLVLQHELTHIFQLDRSRGWWRLAQHVFGRNPVLFPNYYEPAWLVEGLAVYYESRFTSGGRLEGTYQSAVARAAAADHRLPGLDQLSLATSRFPYGESAYVYGSFVWDDLARRRGATRVPEFVERASETPIPFLLDRDARRTFGETFTDAWNQWRDSAMAGVEPSARHGESATGPPVFAAARSQLLSGGGRQIVYPRWRDDSTIVYAANNGRESQGVYIASLGSTPQRLARRNTLDVNAPFAGDGLVYAQGDYIDRLHTRGDLYAERSGGVTRLTTGARLSAPDVHRDGEIVAVQTVPAATRIVRVSSASARITPLTVASLDTQWAAPRWSPDGSAVAAVRMSNGESEIVVLRDDGRNARPVVRARAVLRSPVWSPDGSSILYTSDESGSSQLYTVRIANGRDSVDQFVPQRLTSDIGGIYGADVIPVDGSDSVRVVATVLRGDGYHVAIWTVPHGAIEGSAALVQGPTADRVQTRHDPHWAVVDDSSPSTPYSPWRTLLPAYWSPTFSQESEGAGALVGVLTSGSDVIGRHSYIAQGAVNTRNHNVDASLAYRYDRFLNAVINVSLEQSWSYIGVYGGGSRVGDLQRRDRVASLHLTYARPRTRTYSAVTVGAELEERAYTTDPGALLSRLDPFYARVHRYPTAVLAAAFANSQRPTLSISPEDGIALSGVVRQRWESGSGVAGRTAIGVASGYKSLDLPGFAHHVIAVRLAGGSADRRSPGEFDIGGVNGSSLDVVPGFSLGSASRTFPVRGFVAGSESGIRAVAGSVEYRAPLAMPSQGLGLLPLFVDRVSLTVFSDAARASCPGQAAPVCLPTSNGSPVLASVGMELDLDSALQFDVPYRFRFGIAHPVRGAAYAGASNVSAFVTLGGTF